MIQLTYNQLIKIGANLGHSFLNSKFFSSWMLYGWRSNIFVFDIIFAVYLFRIGITYIRKCVKIYRPVWFVNLNAYFAPFVARYGYVCGESFSVYKWINGTLTNFKSVVGWGKLLYSSAIKNKYEFRHHDRKGLSSLIGFLFSRRRLPGALFLPSLKDCEIVSDEFLSANVPAIGIVDSNVLSWSVSIPIPGNDDSFQCINFYCYLFSKVIISNKTQCLRWWNKYYKIMWRRRRKIKRRLYLYHLVNKYKYKIGDFEENMNLIVKTLKNNTIYWRRPLTKYETLFRSFVKNDIIFRWKR